MFQEKIKTSWEFNLLWRPNQDFINIFALKAHLAFILHKIDGALGDILAMESTLEIIPVEK